MKTEVKHTPGPWRHVTHERDCAILSDDYGPIAATQGDSYGIPEKQSNARLIAAAPELLEALQQMVERFGWPDYMSDHRPEIAAARTAIAKATGE